MKDVSDPCDTCSKVKCDERHLSYFGRAESNCQAWRDYIKTCEAQNMKRLRDRYFPSKQTSLSSQTSQTSLITVKEALNTKPKSDVSDDKPILPDSEAGQNTRKRLLAGGYPINQKSPTIGHQSSLVLLENLRKALDQRVKEAVAERHDAKRPLQANYLLGYAEGIEKALDLFSVFQKNYENQIQMSRKQLSDFGKRLHDDLIWNKNGLPYNVEDAEDLKELVKELLEAQSEKETATL